MKTHNWSDVVKKRYTRKQIAEFRAEAACELLEMNLRALREMSGVTQAQLSKTAKISQADFVPPRSPLLEDRRGLLGGRPSCSASALRLGAAPVLRSLRRRPSRVRDSSRPPLFRGGFPAGRSGDPLRGSAPADRPSA